MRMFTGMNLSMGAHVIGIAGSSYIMRVSGSLLRQSFAVTTHIRTLNGVSKGLGVSSKRELGGPV